MSAGRHHRARSTTAFDGGPTPISWLPLSGSGMNSRERNGASAAQLAGARCYRGNALFSTASDAAPPSPPAAAAAVVAPEAGSTSSPPQAAAAGQ